MKKAFKEGRDALWWISLILGCIVGIMFIIQALFPTLKALSLFIVAYAVLFPLYVFFKEFDRWGGEKWNPRWGEKIVWAWWAIFISLGLAQYILEWRGRPGMIRVPTEMLYICLEVAATYIAGSVSKKLFSRKNCNNQKQSGG